MAGRSGTGEPRLQQLERHWRVVCHGEPSVLRLHYADAVVPTLNTGVAVSRYAIGI